MNVAERSLISEVVPLLQLILVLPSTNAVSQRTFSAMRRLDIGLPTGNYEAGAPESPAVVACPQ